MLICLFTGWVSEPRADAHFTGNRTSRQVGFNFTPSVGITNQSFQFDHRDQIDSGTWPNSANTNFDASPREIGFVGGDIATRCKTEDWAWTVNYLSPHLTGQDGNTLVDNGAPTGDLYDLDSNGKAILR